MELKEFITVTGMLVVIYGAILEVTGLLKTNRDTIIKQAGTYFGYNAQLYVSLIEQRIRSIVGFVCIFTGFIFQFLAVLLTDNFMDMYYAPYILVAFSYISFIIIIQSYIKHKIRLDINYYLIPVDVSEIKKSMIKIQNMTGDSFIHLEKTIIYWLNRVADGLNYKYHFTNLNDDKELIDDLLVKANNYINKNNVYTILNNEL